MDLLFSFLEPERPHSSLLAGYFSKVVVCLLLRKTVPLMNYFRAHQGIMNRLVDLIGITSIMEVLIRLVGSDEHIYATSLDSVEWLEDTNVLEMIVDKFSSSDSPEVHANAAETLCAITRSAPPGLASKISSPSFIKRLLTHALEDSRPKSVLVHLLSVCISLLDPKRLTSGTYYICTRQMAHGSESTANPEIVQGMLESLGDLLKLLDISPDNHVLLTTYGKLQPPLGKHRLKVIEFISVLVGVSSEIAEKELIRLGAVKHILELFFDYPYNNFLHHHAEDIITSCLESKNPQFVDHLLRDCNLIERILEVDKDFILAVNPNKPTIPAEGRSAPRIGNMGHLTRVANKLMQLGNSNNMIHTFLQENNDWVEWQANVLLKRNGLENVFHWSCGRPTSLHDRTQDSDDDYQDKDFDVVALANNLSRAYRAGIYSNDSFDKTRSSLDRDDEDVYFDDESAEVVISSLRLDENQTSGSGSVFTNSNWFAFEDERIADKPPSDSLASSSPFTDAQEDIGKVDDNDLTDTATSELPETPPTSDDNAPGVLPVDFREAETSDANKPCESDSIEHSPPNYMSNATQHPSLPNGELQAELVHQPDDMLPAKAVAAASTDSADEPGEYHEIDNDLPGSEYEDAAVNPSRSKEVEEEK
ncbi:uncharacterized protein LOC127249787 isoform X2 [Andrographis paniculata]|nr:uncharacterized protein LOC127249787 isoform X2 [Andrographis paniculata]